MAVIVDIRKEESFQEVHNLRSVRLSPEESLAGSPGMRKINMMMPKELVIMADDMVLLISLKTNWRV